MWSSGYLIRFHFLNESVECVYRVYCKNNAIIRFNPDLGAAVVQDSEKKN